MINRILRSCSCIVEFIKFVGQKGLVQLGTQRKVLCLSFQFSIDCIQSFCQNAYRYCKPPLISKLRMSLELGMIEVMAVK